MKHSAHTGPFAHMWSNSCTRCDNAGCSLCDEGKRGYGEFNGTQEQYEINRQGTFRLPIAKKANPNESFTHGDR